MIKTKEDLKKYISEDLVVNGLKKHKHNRLKRFLINYRKLEYHYNNQHKLRAFFRHLIDKILQDKMKLFIPINVFGYGLRILQPFVIVINKKSRVGNYCIIHHMVTIGNNKKNEDVAPKIGNNCFIGTGSSILGNIFIGNNCTIGAGAVVTKSFGNDKTLAGVPAKEINN